MKILIFVVLLGLIGCSEPKDYRNSPSEQVEDMEICRKAGMKAALNGFNEIRCSPKPEEYQSYK